MADIITIADAVTTELNAGSFSQEIMAVRLLLPEFELSELSELKVTVVPKGVEMTPFSRQYTQYDFAIDIGIQKKLTGEVDTQMPSMIALADEIVTFLRKRTLSALPAATWLRCLNDPVYSREHLAQSRVFTSVITVTYWMVG